MGLSCAKLSLASAKLHTSLSSDQLKLAMFNYTKVKINHNGCMYFTSLMSALIMIFLPRYNTIHVYAGEFVF